MREIDENTYAKLVQDEKVVSIGQPPQAKAAKANPLSAIRDAITGTGITDALKVIGTAIVGFFHSSETIARERNDILSNLARGMTQKDAREWTFTVERDSQGLIKQIKARRA